MIFFFFFSSRRRHTRCSRDWSSDVCSSDLLVPDPRHGKAFYGVGAVTGIRNEPLAKETADNRARADLAKYMDTYTSYLMRDYAASTTAGDFTKTSEEQNVERALKTFVSTHLSGVLVVDRWEKDDKTGKIIYSLAKLDLDKFKEQIGRASCRERV